MAAGGNVEATVNRHITNGSLASTEDIKQFCPRQLISEDGVANLQCTERTAEYPADETQKHRQFFLINTHNKYVVKQHT